LRFLFDSIVQVSKLVRVGRADHEADLDSDLATLVRAYRTTDIDSLATAAFDDSRANLTGYFADVQDYYTGTAAQLTGVHNADGAIHFGLDWDGSYHDEGFYAQAKIIEEAAKKSAARDVLEIGPGKGFNSIYLARRNPDISFTGVDLTPLHVRLASEGGQGLMNLRFLEGDFHHMSQCADESFDLAFDVEAGCYSDTPEKLEMLFSEIHRVLRPGGRFVAFEYCLSDDFDKVGKKAKLAVELVERAWVVERFHTERERTAAAERAGLRLTERHDLRNAAMPSIVRLYRQARMFYLLMATPLRPLLARLVRRSTHNAVSALMLPYAFGFGALEYRQVVLEKAA
jgi:SAM-dependent methyltransferase